MVCDLLVALGGCRNHVLGEGQPTMLFPSKPGEGRNSSPSETYSDSGSRNESGAAFTCTRHKGL